MAGNSAPRGEVNRGATGVAALCVTAVFGQAVFRVGILAVRLMRGGLARRSGEVIFQVAVLSEMLLGVVVVKEEQKQAAAVLWGPAAVPVKWTLLFRGVRRGPRGAAGRTLA